jgi:hypothetical protein
MEIPRLGNFRLSPLVLNQISDRAVEFDGSIASMVNHGSDETIWDNVVHSGNVGPESPRKLGHADARRQASHHC